MERRRSDRYETSLVVDLLERRGPVRALAVDVGRHGLFVRTQEPPAERILLKVLIHLEDGPIEVLASVMRRVLPGSPAAARLGPGAGLQFFALGPEARSRWERFVAGLRGEVQLPREQRRQIRYSASFLVKVRDLAALRELFTRDISEGGMFLPTPLLQPVGTEVSLLVVHPDSDQEFELVGAVARIQHGSPRGLGIRLNHLSDEQRVAFRRFVESGLSALRGAPRNDAPVEIGVDTSPGLAVGPPPEEAPTQLIEAAAAGELEEGSDWEELQLEEDADIILEGEVLEPIDPQEGGEAQVEVEHGGDASYLDVRFGPPPPAAVEPASDDSDDFEFDLIPGASAAAPIGPTSLDEALEAAGALADADALAPSRAMPRELVAQTFPERAPPLPASVAVVASDLAALRDAEQLLGSAAADGSGPHLTVEEPPFEGAAEIALEASDDDEGEELVLSTLAEGVAHEPPDASPHEPPRLSMAPPPPPGWGEAPPTAPAIPPPAVGARSPRELRIEIDAPAAPRGAPTEATLQAEIQRRPDAMDPRVQLCRLHLAAGRVEAAFAVADAAVKVHGRHPVALSLLARAAAAGGRWSDADAALRKARKAGHVGDEALGREIARALGK